MVHRVLSRCEMGIASEDDVVLVRRKVRELAEKQGFDPFATAAVTTATSELSRNALLHARGGVAILEEIDGGERVGLRMQFKDEGPGIVELQRALEGGYSTARSLGLGLSGSRRLADEFHIDTVVGRGTEITIIKWKRAV